MFLLYVCLLLSFQLFEEEMKKPPPADLVAVAGPSNRNRLDNSDNQMVCFLLSVFCFCESCHILDIGTGHNFDNGKRARSARFD